jgi:hypothetical protein
MDNSDVSSQEVAKKAASEQVLTTPKKHIILASIVVVFIIIVVWLFSTDNNENVNDSTPIVAVQEVPVITEVIEEEELEPVDVVEVISAPVPKPPPEIVEPVKELINPLPLLDDSDSWLKLKLPELTWRTELLQLVIDEDMIRRFVVFTDNFAQGSIAYEHSPFILPKEKFSVGDKESNTDIQTETWQWNDKTSKRFNAYIDLLRSIDSAHLVDWYFEAKPLVDQAYGELGYEDDFTLTLQDAITRVLDMELPKSDMTLTRPSVMYKYKETELESLDDSEKLLLRLGKENLLVIKSVLLEINEKLAKQHNGIN